MGIISTIFYGSEISRARKSIEKTLAKMDDDSRNKFMLESLAMYRAMDYILNCTVPKRSFSTDSYISGDRSIEELLIAIRNSDRMDIYKDIIEIIQPYHEKGFGIWSGHRIKMLEKEIREKITGIEIDDHYRAATSA